jgi:hypothetical protein
MIKGLILPGTPHRKHNPTAMGIGKGGTLHRDPAARYSDEPRGLLELPSDNECLTIGELLSTL